MPELNQQRPRKTGSTAARQKNQFTRWANCSRRITVALLGSDRLLWSCSSLYPALACSGSLVLREKVTVPCF
ncbi:hypothetical protein BDV33DRAFT_2123 [Aspergillus novoparasiticus]|uniref:Uncharacterized protein n=1 Tax=Aspergillus novoparasiticus TaxID=986946 RepID=A0A5N6FA64_9EURO|nr:hypothetical protein BDV33DRAFT_2123 [Aspergillus novoparasiticus]